MTRTSIRDMLYEAPGPKAQRRIRLFTVLALLLLAAFLAVIIRQFTVTGQFAEKYWAFFTKLTTWRFLGEGLLTTLEAALTGSLIAFALGFLLMRGKLRRNPVIRTVSTALIEFTRGVPTLLFIYFFFLVVPKTGWKPSAFWKITLPCAISACGVVAEALRSGVNAVPKGQTEAALSLGLTETRLFYRVVFPQAFRFVIPSLIAELVIVLKDTTFAYIVTCADLMQNAKVLISNYDAMLSVYLVVAVIYILINYMLNKVSDRLALKLRRTPAEGSKA
ncbi:amino acid ABC transporter permease [Aristaeella hokkaidonensis]|uniref:Amino acid ABC transporter permease n=1 Tax=Aristaeella hokkaidonensis TaxID=3046382 RepID=A0AC61MWT0_9FIRM|nr:amino acid ABC transporter permease [Aristaeella hokkaidonensis]QUC67270.1 amino acid ABC transporter permease [Aristaeella hokkaidonensis]SNT93407.1 amino acid ABC transporter membrane protein 2, PAAT family [Aristaeella hokkaidonensis]